jgi:hypothetical protein
LEVNQMRSGTERTGGEECGDPLRGGTSAANGCSADRSRAEGAQKDAVPAESAAETAEFERGAVERISEEAQGSGEAARLLPAEELDAEA